MTSAFDTQTSEWHQNKIRGGIAESACRAHFELLGYAVESTGIEHIASQYSRLNGHPVGSYIRDVKKIQKLPDFLISRIHPATTVNLDRGEAGKADAVFVEAKYRTNVVLEDFTREMLENYKSLLEKKIHFIVYLVCKNYKKNDSEVSYHSDQYVFLYFFNPDVSNTGWEKAGDWWGFSKFPLYQGMKDGLDFNTAYRQVVEPALREMLK